MLREEEREGVSMDIFQANANDFVFYVGNEPVMKIAVDLIPKIGARIF